MDTPEGFNQYYVLITPNGRIFQILSCSLVKVDVFDERELSAALGGPETLDKTLERFDAEWLAPIVRKGLRENLTPQVAKTVEAVGKIWRKERTIMERIGQIVAEISIEDLIRAVVALDEDPR